MEQGIEATTFSLVHHWPLALVGTFFCQVWSGCDEENVLWHETMVRPNPNPFSYMEHPLLPLLFKIRIFLGLPRFLCLKFFWQCIVFIFSATIFSAPDPPDAAISPATAEWFVGLEKAELMCISRGYPKPENVTWKWYSHSARNTTWPNRLRLLSSNNKQHLGSTSDLLLQFCCTHGTGLCLKRC